MSEKTIDYIFRVYSTNSSGEYIWAICGMLRIGLE